MATENKNTTAMGAPETAEKELDLYIDGDLLVSAMQNILKVPQAVNYYNGQKYLPAIAIKVTAENNLSLQAISTCSNNALQVTFTCNIPNMTTPVAGDVVLLRKHAEKLLMKAFSEERLHITAAADILQVEVSEQIILHLHLEPHDKFNWQMYHEEEDTWQEFYQSSISQGELKELLKVTFATTESKYDERKATIWFYNKNGLIVADATDGYRVARATADVANFSIPEFSFHKATGSFLRSVLKETGQAKACAVFIKSDARKIVFSFADAQLGKWEVLTPQNGFKRYDIDSIMPQEEDIKYFACFDAREILSFAGEEHLYLYFAKDNLTISTTNKARQYYLQQVIPLISHNCNFAKAECNGKFLIEALKNNTADDNDGTIELSKDYIIIRSKSFISFFPPISENKKNEIADAELPPHESKSMWADCIADYSAKIKHQHEFPLYLWDKILREAKPLDNEKFSWIRRYVIEDDEDEEIGA